MRIITLTTDFGTDSHYLVSVKAVLFSGKKDVSVIDISHNIERFDINEGAYVMGLVLRDFPENTIHIIGLDTESPAGKRILCVKHLNQFFIVPDNGLMSLIAAESEWDIFEITAKADSLFTVRDVMARQALLIVENDYQPDKLYKRTDVVNKKSKINPVIHNTTLQGTIAYVDSYGNAFTNITKKIFEEFVGNNKFRIILSHFESIDKIHQKFSDVAEGQTVCIFDESDYLMIRINQGKASQLYNLRKSKPIMIELA